MPDLVFGDDKNRLLARRGIQLSIHCDARPGCFEWARMVETMAKGCCKITEQAAGFEPFVAGEHCVVTDDLDGEVSRLPDHPVEGRRIGQAARRAVLEQHPLASTLASVLDELDGLRLRPVEVRQPPRYRRRMIVAQRNPLLSVFRSTQSIRQRIYQALMAETTLQRRIERAQRLLRHGVGDHVEVVESEGCLDASPQVNVVVTLFNYAGLVTETLETITVSQGPSSRSSSR